MRGQQMRLKKIGQIKSCKPLSDYNFNSGLILDASVSHIMLSVCMRLYFLRGFAKWRGSLQNLIKMARRKKFLTTANSPPANSKFDHHQRLCKKFLGKILRNTRSLGNEVLWKSIVASVWTCCKIPEWRIVWTSVVLRMCDLSSCLCSEENHLVFIVLPPYCHTANVWRHPNATWGSHW